MVGTLLEVYLNCSCLDFHPNLYFTNSAHRKLVQSQYWDITDAFWQTIHMKCQDLFSSENKKNQNCLSALVATGALRV